MFLSDIILLCIRWDDPVIGGTGPERSAQS